jgi:ribonuclease HII
MRHVKYIIGVDEAGRGSLAGPVVVGVCSAPFQKGEKVANAQSRICIQAEEHCVKAQLRDSKKLTKRAREEWFAFIKDRAEEKDLKFAYSSVSPRYIDKAGISNAVTIAVNNALKKLHIEPQYALILLDGSLYAPREYVQQRTIIRGDETEPLISLASVVAKVARDRIMVRLSKNYSLYQFERHKGYGTPAHIRAIQEHGHTDMHRKTFLTKILK